MKAKDVNCQAWKEGKGRGFKHYKNCSTCDFAGYGLCLHPNPDERDLLNKPKVIGDSHE